MLALADANLSHPAAWQRDLQKLGLRRNTARMGYISSGVKMLGEVKVADVARWVESVDLHCQNCKKLSKVSLSSFGDSDQRLAEIEKGFRCTDCGLGPVKMLLPDDVKRRL